MGLGRSLFNDVGSLGDMGSPLGTCISYERMSVYTAVLTMLAGILLRDRNPSSATFRTPGCADNTERTDSDTICIQVA